MPAYVVVRRDGIVLVTDRLGDARRSFRVGYARMKYSTKVRWLRQYGRVVGRVIRGKAEPLAGVHRLEGFIYALERAYSGKRYARSLYARLVDASKNVSREKRPTRPKVERPVIALDLNDPRAEMWLRKRFRRVKSRAVNVIRISSYFGDRMYIVETSRSYWVVDYSGNAVLIIKKGYGAGEVAKYFIDQLTDSAAAAVRSPTLVDCSRFTFHEWRDLCERVFTNYVVNLKSVLELVS